MRYGWFALIVLVGILGHAGPSAAASSVGATVTLVGVGHALDERTLTITGWVENRGPRPLVRLVIDALGYAPTGELVAFGGDGIPWELPVGGSERFSIALPIPAQLIRDYLLRVSTASAPSQVVASERHAVRFEAYRTLLLARIGVRGDLRRDLLKVQASVDGLPVSVVTVRATVLVTRTFRTEIVTLDLDVPGDGSATIALGTLRATLLSLRVLDIQTKSAWSD